MATRTEYRVIGEADLDTVPILRVGWSSPEHFETLDEARNCVARHRTMDPGAINPRIQSRTVTDWEDVTDGE